MKLVFLGAPGAGKGTQARNISKELNVPHISTGDLLREEIANGTVIGAKVADLMNDGMLVPDDIVTNLLKRELVVLSTTKGFVLDGYPRNIWQAENCEMIGGKLDLVVFVDVPDEVIIKRMTGRRVCPKCGAMYHILHSPPTIEGMCNKERERLVIRKDDNKETVMNRLEVFHKLTAPIIQYYEKQDLLFRVNGTKEINEITKEITGKIAANIV
jgi:adenylate kinase